MMKTAPPPAGTYNDYYRHYVDLVPEKDLLAALENDRQVQFAFFSTLSEEQGELRYAEGKWSIKEILQHLIDTERIFVNRALRFARADQTDLPGYEHNDYVPISHSDRRSMQDLCAEWDLVRRGTIALFRSFDAEMMQRSGTANGGVLTVVSIGYLTAGHGKHHAAVVRERYLS